MRWREGVIGRRKNLAELPGLSGGHWSLPPQVLGAEVTRVVLSLSLVLDNSVQAEEDIRPSQPSPERKHELATSARTQEKAGVFCIFLFLP